MAIHAPYTTPFSGSPNAGGYDGLFANIIAAFSQAQAALVAPNKLLDMVRVDFDPKNTAHQGKTIEINFPDSLGKVKNMNQMGTPVTYSPVRTITRMLTLDQHPVYGFEIPDLDKALVARPEELRTMFVDEAIKKFLTHMNQQLAKLIFNTQPATDPGDDEPFGQVFGVPPRDSLFKVNPSSPPASYGSAATREWSGYADKGINPVLPDDSETEPVMTIRKMSRIWRKLVEAKCPVQDVQNMFLLVPSIVWANMIEDSEWQQSAVGEQIAAGIRRTGRVGSTFGIYADWELDIPKEVEDDDESPNYEKERYHSFAFHRDAMAVAYRPLDLPPPSTGVQASMAFYRNIPIRFMLSYDRDLMTYKLTFDALYGAMVFRPEFGVRAPTKWLDNTWDD
jgi:hypothetical protein